MPVFTRPDAEIHCEVHGSGHPLLLFAPGGLTAGVIKKFGPTRLAESIRRVGDFLARHTPAS